VHFSCQESLHLGLNPRYLDTTNILDLTNNKQREQLCILIVRKDKRKKKYKQSIIGDNSTIICRHKSHHVEEGTAAHLVRRYTHLFNSTGATHSLEYEEHAPTTFQLKNNKYTVKILKRPRGLFNIHVKKTKILPQTKFFFF
jgi:hypothetical protein